MRIVIGTESFVPSISGVVVMTELLARYLSSQGHEVYIFAPRHPLRHNDGLNVNGVTVRDFRSVLNPFRKGFRLTAFPRREVARAIQEIKPDIVHLQDPACLCGSLRMAAKANGIPVVVANHFNLDYVLSYLRYLAPLHSQINSMLAKYLVSFYDQCDLVLCPTETVKKQLENMGVEAPIEAISNGVDLERFHSYSALGAIHRKYHLPIQPIVMYVGRIDTDKSVEVLVRAIPRVLESCTARFVFIGDGGETAKLKKLVEELGISWAVSFLGWVHHDSADLPRLYQIASMFAIPSAIETQSIVTLEALASGLPVVAANAAALPELVRDGENGYLFPPGDSEAMADKICRILGDKNLRDKMGKKSLEIVCNHGCGKSFERFENLYEGLIQRPKA